MAFYSEEPALELEVKAAQSVGDVLSGRPPGSVVNAQVLALPQWAHLSDGTRGC